MTLQLFVSLDSNHDLEGFKVSFGKPNNQLQKDLKLSFSIKKVKCQNDVRSTGLTSHFHIAVILGKFEKLLRVFIIY